MKRFTAFLLVAAMLSCAAVFASADSTDELTLVFTPEGRMVKDMDGNKVNGAVSDRIFNKIYLLAEDGRIDLKGVKSSEFEVTVDENGKVTFGKQTLTAKDGTVYTSSNAEAVIFQQPNEFYPCGGGEAVLTVSGASGAEIAASTAHVTAMTSGKNIIVNPCPQCGDNQPESFHALSCGHFTCDAGEVDHGTAACGSAGHFKCDGNDHGICPNCLGRICEGEHGAGVCKHTHTVKSSNLMYSKSQDGMFRIIYCPTCGIYYIDQLW